jgi:hypothetical protein
MFEIKYRLSKKEYEALQGDKGYYQMIYNESSYGDMYPAEMEEIMGTMYLYDWLKDMIQVAIELHSKTYIALSNIESYNLWIEFKKVKNNLYIRIVTADKPNGVGVIVYELKNREYKDSNENNSYISFEDFKQEIITKCTSYMQFISEINNLSDDKQKINSFIKILNQLENVEID